LFFIFSKSRKEELEKIFFSEKSRKEGVEVEVK